MATAIRPLDPAAAIAIPRPATTPLGRPRWALVDGWTVARRNLSHVRRVPEKLLDVTLQPIIFVLLFAYVFGSAIEMPGGGNYREYLMAGIFAQTMAFTAAGTAIGVATDMAKGIVDRFRSLPMARSAVLTGRTVADLVASLLGVAVMAGAGLAVGWRAHNGVGATLAAFGILLLFGFAMTWVGTYVGLLVRTPEAAQTIMFTVMFPLTFVANTFVPTAGMPGWLRVVADWNPLSAVVAASRRLFGNPTAVGPVGEPAWPLQHPIVAAVGWSLLILAVAVPLAVRRYCTAASG